MLAIIPARGGSKGLPGKNIRELEGIPLIAHTIRAAQKSKYITRILVSTDDQVIYDIGLEYGAGPSFLRPVELASDTAMAVDAYIYTLDRLEKDFSEKYSEVIILQPTSPLRLAEDIDGAIELFKEKKADSVITYTEEHHPIFWHKYINEDLTLEPIFTETLDNRQALRRSYFPNGAVYVFKADLLRQKKYTTDKTYAYLMPRSRSVDIDTLEDFEYAALLFSKRNNKK